MSVKSKVDGGEDPSRSSTGSRSRFLPEGRASEGLQRLLLQTFAVREAPASPLLLLSFSPSARFRQIEVFHQVTTAFSSLGRTSSPPRRAHPGQEPTERRRHVAALFRRAASRRTRPAEAAADAEEVSAASAASAAPRPPPAGDKSMGFINAVEQQDGREDQEPSQKASWPVKEKPPTFLRGPAESPGMVRGASEAKVSQAAS